MNAKKSVSENSRTIFTDMFSFDGVEGLLLAGYCRFDPVDSLCSW